MKLVVVDTSVVLKWFRTTDERFVEEANLLLRAASDGQVTLLAPMLLRLEILNVAARRWKLPRADLELIAGGVEELGIEFCEVPPNLVVHWVAKGLTAYDAVFVALAQSRKAFVVSDDRQIAVVGGDLVIALSDVRTALG